MQNVSHVKLNFALIRAGRVIFEGTLHTVDGPEKKVEFGGRPRGSPRVDFLKNESGAAPGLPRGCPGAAPKSKKKSSLFGLFYKIRLRMSSTSLGGL